MQEMDCIVKFDYNAQDIDELTIRKGDKIINSFKKEDGWMEGELNGKRGLFPDNYIEIISKKTVGPPMAAEKRKNFLSDLGHKIAAGGDKKSIPVVQQTISPRPPPAQNKPSQNESSTAASVFKVKVLYSYTPLNEDELRINENDIVDVLRLVEDGWFEGVCNGKRGVFPSNYVAKIEPSVEKSLNSSIEEIDIEEKKTVRKVGGVGFGNIFSGNKIELRTKDNNYIKVNGGQQQQPANVVHIPSPPSTSTPPASAQVILPKPAVVSKARVVFNYKPTQSDELQLQIGEIINVLDKNLEDEGWWKGEINGRVGVFPDNFVEEIIIEQNKKPISPPPPQQQQIPQQITPNNANTNSNALLIDSNTSKLQVSSSSASSSTSSLVAPQTTPVPPPQQQQLNQSNEINLDESLKLDDVQSDSKLTHLKKTKQNNKRPPSFRLKSHGEKIQDAESLLAELAINGTATTNVSDQNVKPTTPIPNEIKRDESIMSEQPQSTFKTPSPPPPPYTSPVNSATNLTTSNTSNLISAAATAAANNEEIKSLKQEIESLKDFTTKLANDYKQLQIESKSQKLNYDEQLQKFQKKLKDLVEEIDEEKKTRLALQVELERIKKTLTHI